MKYFTLALKILGGILGGFMLLALVAFGLIQTSFVQNKLLNYATNLLREELKTEIKIDRISINFMGRDARLYGFELEDQQHRKMLVVEELGLGLDFIRLFNHEVKVTDAFITGLSAQLYKPSPDSVANYQFLIDAFKSKKATKKKPQTGEKKQKLSFDVEHVMLNRINVSYNNQKAELDGLEIDKQKDDSHKAIVKGLSYAWIQQTKKGPVDSRLRLSKTEIAGNQSKWHLTFDSLYYFTDNHKPRKNVGKPKRGFFDVGHFDIAAKLDVDIEHVAKDTLVAAVTHCDALDRGSGLHVTDLHFKVTANKQHANLRDVTIKMPNTTLTFAYANVQLPSKKENRKLAYTTSTIKGTVLLKDIARPFSLVLSKFSLPLQLQTYMSGDDDNIYFNNVLVTTTDKKFSVKAKGNISNLKDKYKLHVHFDVNQMKAHSGSKEIIISQFPVKKFMMKQLHALGNISYNGHFDVLWKKELFDGLLKTETGDLRFNLGLDEENKYVSGKVSTDSFELGRAMDMPGLGKIVCKANFKFDISKPRTAKMRKLKGGKLPIGHVDAEIEEAKYKLIRARRVFAEINSDGAVAEGNITVKGKYMDMLCSFSFTNTNEMQKTKVKPGIKFHQLSEEDKAKKEEKKRTKEMEKEEKKRLKDQEKAEKKLLKEKEKAEKKLLKEKEKAEKKQRKEEEKAEKQRKKAERKAQKEAAQAI